MEISSILIKDTTKEERIRIYFLIFFAIRAQSTTITCLILFSAIYYTTIFHPCDYVMFKLIITTFSSA